MKIWNIIPSFECQHHQLALEEEEPPRFELVNRAAVLESGLARFVESGEYDAYADEERELMAFAGMVQPVFRIADPDFARDYFERGGLRCVSGRLRQVLGLTAQTIRYRDIDLDGSPPAVHAQAYQAFQVVPFADPIDWARTPCEILEYQRPDGSIRRQRVPAHPMLRPRTFWREDFMAPAALFRTPVGIWAVDELAARVMGAGITDVQFQDVTSERAQTEEVLRQF
jgi:hypothetical protein